MSRRPRRDLLLSGVTLTSEPDLNQLPRCVDNKTGAELVTKFFFPISPRSLERWPVERRRVNNASVMNTAALFAEAQARLDAAPVIKTGFSAAA